MTTHTTTQTASTSTRAAHRLRIGAPALAAAAAAALLPMTSAAADTPPVPADTHCPAGFPLLAISQFDPFYNDWLTTVVDLNGNGLVCARQFPEATAAARGITPPGYPLYLARDDSIVG